MIMFILVDLMASFGISVIQTKIHTRTNFITAIVGKQNLPIAH